MYTTVIGKPILPDEHITIAGAGISGLLTGYFLKRKDYRFSVIEKASNAGGLLQTRGLQQGLAESAANGLLLTPLWEEILKEIKLTPLPADKTKSTLIDNNFRGN